MRRISEFGSLGDRTNRSTPDVPQPAGGPICHAWLDGDIPVLLLRWRRTEGGWEGKCSVPATTPALATVWVIAQRLTPASRALRIGQDRRRQRCYCAEKSSTRGDSLASSVVLAEVT